jgi:hypothetical protein
MMNGGMGSMMAVGWLGGLLVAAFLIAVVVWGVLALVNREGRPATVGLTILAVIGGIALIAILAMLFMHFGMMGGMMSCC